jgi:hypothetical protein
MGWLKKVRKRAKKRREKRRDRRKKRRRNRRKKVRSFFKGVRKETKKFGNWVKKGGATKILNNPLTQVAATAVAGPAGTATLKALQVGNSFADQSGQSEAAMSRASAVSGVDVKGARDALVDRGKRSLFGRISGKISGAWGHVKGSLGFGNGAADARKTPANVLQPKQGQKQKPVRRRSGGWVDRAGYERRTRKLEQGV